MSYYMRYIVVGEGDVSLSRIETALASRDPRYSLRNGKLAYGGRVYGVVEINVPGEDLFEEEREELLEEIEDIPGENARKVRQALRKARAIIAVQVIFGNCGTEATLQKIDPLWEWLFSTYEGYLQADGEGYYDGTELILEVA
ncbi:MAG: hypothetical protein H5U08_03900 [Thermogutta sp.]|uniref:hypothetical protein n=1 Tax=Thermogutta sp. TaxID=1962930 RepID=UPI0019B0EE4D|nr:hypothetical protein [Thermogutta sp.]MBC7351481.1 hypothetical protein [Thermogutta sp.]